MVHIFYHGGDLDGKCSGALVNVWHRDHAPDFKVKLHPIDYDDTFPWNKINKEDTVYMVDFALQPYSDMEKLNKMCKLVWIDHHKSAIDGVKDGDKIDGVRDIHHAGCELTWMHLNKNKPIPQIVALLGRYDVWDNANKERWEDIIEPFQFGMKAFDTDPKSSECVFYRNVRENFIDIGKKIRRYQLQLDESYMKQMAYPIDFEGYSCIAANYRGNSISFKSVWDEDRYDIMVMYYHLGGKGIYTVSLYTTKAEVDCSKIAVKHGGGGHASAAGFQTKELPWMEDKSYEKEKMI